MNIRRFDLNLLRALDALLHERNVTRAAARLGITQQAMSGTLRRLREQFDDPLLVRFGHTLRQTARAEALVTPVRQAMRQIEQLLHLNPGFDAAASRRRFVVAMSDYAAVTILPPAIGLLSAAAPGIKLDIRPIDKDTPDALDQGNLDLCLLPSDWGLFKASKPEHVCSQALYEDDFVCVVAAANADVGAAIDRDHYLAMAHTSLRLDDGVSSVVESAWREQGLTPHVAATASSFAGMIFMVTESRLVATVQRRLAERFARMAPIRVLECPIPIKPLSAHMNWHASRDDDPGHRFLRETFARASVASRRHK